MELNVIENTQIIGKYWLFLERDCQDSYYCDGENEHLHNTFFFIMTLLTTIGYSSNIRSVLGKIIVTVVIIFQYGILELQFGEKISIGGQFVINGEFFMEALNQCKTINNVFGIKSQK